MRGIEALARGHKPPRLSPRRYALLMVRITDHLRPIEIGVTNRIRTGTNAVTGRDAAVTS
jgi:hypothetical protein